MCIRDRNYIIENGGFSIETYCLLRHLIKFTNNNLNDFIMALATRLNFSNCLLYTSRCV